MAKAKRRTETTMWILLVEDDRSTADSIELMLRGEGYVVDKTEFGKDGFEFGQAYDYDLIILDLMLPDIDGYQVLEGLRAHNVATPVMILSGMDAPDDKVKGLGLGADVYLTKPVDRRELIAHIEGIVRRAKGPRETVERKGRLTMLSERTGVHG
jgi:two-component system cell cycle response regulator CtrA